MFSDSKISSSVFRPMTAGGKPSKKRVAPSQIGPKPKKIHSEKSQIKDKKPSVFKRDRPVTLPQVHDSGTSSGGEAGSLSEDGDAELTDEDEGMLGVLTKDPDGRCRVPASELDARLMDRTVQLRRKRTRHRKFSLNNARLQSLMLHYSKTLNVHGVLPCGKTLARSGRSTLLILRTSSVVMLRTSSSSTMPVGSSRLSFVGVGLPNGMRSLQSSRGRIKTC